MFYWELLASGHEIQIATAALSPSLIFWRTSLFIFLQYYIFFPLQKRSTFAAGPNLHRNLTEPWKTDEYGYKVCVAHSITNQGNSFGKWYWIIVRLLWHINVWSILLLLLKCFRERAALPCGLHCGVHAAWGSLPRYFHAFIILQWAIDFFVVFCLLSTEKKPLDSVFWNVTVHRINMRWNRKKWSTCMEKVCVTKMDWNAILKSILDGDAVWKQN